jgi:type IV pilus assembly protein PilQ
MQVFADFTNINIVVNDNVQGSLTLRLKDVPWDQAFDIVLQTKNLGSKRNGNIIWVAPKDEMIAKEKQELEGKAQIADLEPVRSQTIQLQYHKADVVARSLMGEGESKSAPIISKRGSVIFDSRTNQLFISDTPSKLEEVSQLIQKIDVPVRQVVIEARIVEANDTFGRNLGVKLGFADLRQPFQFNPATGKYETNSGFGLGGSRLGVSGNQNGGLQTFGALPSDNEGVRYDIPNTNFLSLPAGPINGFTPSSLGFSLFSAGAQTLLNLELSALEADGKGKIVSSPRILTTDKQKALIEQGTELPYQSATSSGATSVQFKKANLKLEVTPQITPEGKVFLDVDLNKDSPSAITNGSAGLAIDTKHVQTQVLVDNGGTVMIGGIFQETERKNTTKVPLLGDLPFVGNLFKNTSRNKERSEILIFLTPKVIEVGTVTKTQ